MAKSNNLSPIHPGEILKEEFMVPLSLSANQLALRLHVPTGRITSIINGQRAITPETALRFAAFLACLLSFGSIYNSYTSYSWHNKRQEKKFREKFVLSLVETELFAK